MMEDFSEWARLALSLVLITIIAIVLHEVDREEPEAITSTVCISLEDYTALTTKE